MKSESLSFSMSLIYGTELEDIVFKPSTFNKLIEAGSLEVLPPEAAGVAPSVEFGKTLVVFEAIYCIEDKDELG